MKDSLLIEIETMIATAIEEYTKHRPSEDEYSKPLKSFGLTSVQGMLLIGQIEDQFNIDIHHDYLLGNDSLSAFAKGVYLEIKG